MHSQLFIILIIYELYIIYNHLLIILFNILFFFPYSHWFKRTHVAHFLVSYGTVFYFFIQIVPCSLNKHPIQ